MEPTRYPCSRIHAEDWSGDAMKIAVPMITAAVQTSSKASTKGRPFCRFTNEGNRIEPTTGPTAATTPHQAPALPSDRPYSVITVSGAQADRKRVGSGKSVSALVRSGGRRDIKTKA